jgi:glycosyltransferase involved in cell wall biosynthesis
LPGTKLPADLTQVLDDREVPVEIVEQEGKHYSLAEQTKLLSLLNKIKPDLVHFPHFNHPMLYQGDFVVTIHDLTLSHYAERGGFFKRILYNEVISHAAKKSKKILTVSNFVAKEIAKEFSVPITKVVTTYNGIDPKFKKITNPRILKKVENYGLTRPYVLSVGQWRSHKNLLRLVKAFSKIADKPGLIGYDLVFAGRQDDKYPQLQDAISSADNLKNRVKFTGFVEDDDLPVIYNNASAFAFPSLSEGFGLPGLEAQACGTPVVSSDRTCMKEIYGDGALYFDPTDVGQMAQKIETILLDNSLRSQLIQKGFTNAKKFNWQITGQKTLEVYKEILYK